MRVEKHSILTNCKRLNPYSNGICSMSAEGLEYKSRKLS